jgi:hypothetical protein
MIKKFIIIDEVYDLELSNTLRLMTHVLQTTYILILLILINIIAIIKSYFYKFNNYYFFNISLKCEKRFDEVMASIQSIYRSFNC